MRTPLTPNCEIVLSGTNFTFMVGSIYTLWGGQLNSTPITLNMDMTSSRVTLHSGLTLTLIGNNIVKVSGTITDSRIDYITNTSIIL